MAETIRIDAMGSPCPLPVVKAKKALDAASTGTVLEVHVDNEIAVQNLMKMARNQQCGSESEKIKDKHYIVFITAGEQTDRSGHMAEEKVVSCDPAGDSGTVVMIDSMTMGSGNDALGKVLMKGFLYAVSQLEELPKTILFYNGGIMLTTEGSDSLEDLKAMEEQGVEILSCGTCLDYYERKDKLMVGDVTNMYSIVEAMAGASRILKP